MGKRIWLPIILSIILISLFYSMFFASAQNVISGHVIGIQFGNKDSTGVGYLSGVNVSVWNETSGILVNSTLTGSDGAYYFVMTNPGNYNLTFTKSGYPYSIPSQPLSVTTSDVNRIVYLYADEVGSFNVTVLDSKNNRPIPNATIVIEHGACKLNNNCPTGKTDDAGNVMIGVKAITQGITITHTFNVTALGYQANNTYTDQINEGQNKNITIKLNGEYRVYGYIKDVYRCSGCSGEYLQNAFVELICGYKTSNPKLNWSDTYFYNTTTASNGFYQIYYPSTLDCNNIWVHADATGYDHWRENLIGGSAEVSIGLNGSAFLNGTVIDRNNQSLFLSATVTVINPAYGNVYVINSGNDGVFYLRVRDGEDHRVVVSKSGYLPNSTGSIIYSSNHSYGKINLTGAGVIEGNVIDKYNNSIAIDSVNVTMISTTGNTRYLTTTDSNGHFSLNVSSVLNYTLVFNKEGYKQKTLLNVEVGDQGNIELEGISLVNGTVTDCYTNLQLPGNKINNTKVQIISSNLSLPNAYTVYTNSNGFYQAYIPSTIGTYTITFSREEYQTKTISYNDDHNVCLNGKTYIYGRVVDRDAVESYEGIGGATIRVFDSNNNVYYEATTNSDGNYSLYVGYLESRTNYTVNISKSGYYTETYENNSVPDWSHTYNELIGKTVVRVTVKDEYDSSPINGSEVCIQMEEQEYNSYMDCIYNEPTGLNGTHTFNIKLRDSSHKYKVRASKSGYSTKTVGPYSGDINLTIPLYAATTVHVTDAYASQNYRNVKNATVTLYYNFTRRGFKYNLTQTIVNATVYCNSTQKDGLNVSLLCLDCVYPYYRSYLTSDGLANVTFYRTPVGSYNITINGSSVGCGVNTSSFNISTGGITYSGANFIFNVGKTGVILKTVNPALAAIASANVSLLTDSSINCTTGSNGVCTLYYVPGGNQTFKAVAEHYYNTTKNYTVQAGAVNDFTSDPIVMNPRPGNLSVLVLNTSDSPINSTNVTISNSTASSSKLTDTSGWANFTDVISINNITVNGSLQGYNYTQILNVYVEPDNITIVNATLQENWLKVVVYNKTSDLISGANVTLWNGSIGSQIAKNVSGDYLTSLTNSSGVAEFHRIITGTYNLTVNKSDEGLSYEVEISIINFVERIVYLNDTTPPQYNSSLLGQNVSNINDGDHVKAYAYWTDNVNLSSAILSTNKTNEWVNESTKSISGNSSWSNFTITTNSSHAGKTIGWRIYANDTSGNWNVTPITTFSVNDTTPPQYSDVNDNVSGSANEGEIVKVYAYWTDNVGLSFAILETNKTDSWVNESSISLSGTGNYSNFTINTSGYAGKTIGWRIYANDTSNNWNVTPTKSFDVAANTLRVYVNDTDGNAVGEDDQGNGVNVTLSNSTYSSSKNTTNLGYVTFTVSQGYYNVSVNGSRQGYGLNETKNVQVSAGSNTITILVNSTKLTVNVTSPQGSPVTANVTVYESDDTTVAQNATGGYLNGTTDVDGLITFNRVLPCTNCNVTITNGTKTNSTKFNISAGNQSTVHLDPEVPSPGEGVEGYNVTLNFTIRVENVSNSELDNITVTIRKASGFNMSNLTVDGEVLIHNVPSGYYNFTIDGEAVGLSKLEDNSSIGVGKIVSNAGNTEGDGRVSLQINGFKTYFVRVEAYGYESFDDEDNGSSGRNGSQTIEIPLNGSVSLTGVVYDSKFISYEPVDNSTISVYRSSTCSNLDPNMKRYQSVTLSTGTYSLKVSSVVYGSGVETNYESYCIKSVADGYTSNVIGPFYLTNTTEEKNISMTGDSYVKGWVKDIISLESINGSKYPTSITLKSRTCYPDDSDCDAYETTTNDQGYFHLDVSSRTKYVPYNITIDSKQGGWCLYRDNLTIPSEESHYLIGSEYAKLNVNITSDLGENITNNVSIKLIEPGNVTVTLGSTPTCVFDESTNVMSCYVTSGTKTLIVNGSKSGYGINQTTFSISSTNCELQTKRFNITLNSTKLNITLRDEEGNPLNDVNIEMNSSSFQNVTANGSILFKKVPIGLHNFTFSGNQTDIYFYNRTNIGTLEVTLDMAGKLNDLTYVLNETRVLINVTNESGANVTGLNLSITNLRTDEQWYDVTDSEGKILLERQKYGNLSISFNDSVLYQLGFIPPSESILLSVTPGEDENTTNNFNIALNDTEVRFNITNTSKDGLGNVNITLISNGSVARSGYNKLLTGLTDSSGILILHNVIPSSYTSPYTYDIDANSSGYGIWRNYSITVVSSGTNVSRTLEPLRLDVYVYNKTGGQIDESVNISLLINGTLVKNARNEYLNKTTMMNATFLYLYVANYTINLTSSKYFSQVKNFSTENLTNPNQTINFTLFERTLYVFVRDSDGNVLGYGVDISLTDETGSPVMGTNGSYIPVKTNVTDNTFFEYIPDGTFVISVISNYYFRTNWTFNTTNLYTISNVKNFTLYNRTLTVNIYDMFSSPITDYANVSIVNASGVVLNTTGSSLSKTTNTSKVTFRGIPDGVFNVSVIVEGYVPENKTLVTPTYTGSPYNFYLKRVNMGYFNVTVRDTNGNPLSGVFLELKYNNTVSVSNGTTNSKGLAILDVNTSQYTSLLNITASKSGYYSNITGPYTCESEEVKQINITLTAAPGERGPPEGGVVYVPPSVAPPCEENWTCSEWSECSPQGVQTRVCSDTNNCGTTENKPSETRSCVYVGVGMELTLPQVSINPGSCGTANIYVENIGKETLSNIYATNVMEVPNCCKITSEKTISSLPSGSSQTIPLTICVYKTTERGEYQYSITVFSDKTSKSVDSNIKVPKSYGDVLLGEINQLNSTLTGIEREELTFDQLPYYDNAVKSLEYARKYILNNQLGKAEEEIAKADDYLSQLEVEKPPVDIYFVMLLVIIVVVAGGFAFWLYRKRKFYVYMPKYRPPKPPGVVINKDALLEIVDGMNERILKLRLGKLSETERYYYDKVKEILEDIKSYIINDDLKSAMMFIDDAEKYLKMLEEGLSGRTHTE
jgi:hypothetical protein